jgi:hypothetical protein
MKETNVERFYRNVYKTETCWNWTGCKAGGEAGKHYGTFWMDGKNLYAHRASLILAGTPPKDCEVVCHKCDNRLCVNPSHLFVATHSVNTIDAINKGRHKSVAEYSKTKCRRMEDWEVKLIRSLRSIGIKGIEVARIFDIHPVKVSQIFTGFRYKHV